MSDPKNPWLASLREHRIALGIAVAASILLMALLVMRPGSQSESDNNRARKASPLEGKQHAAPATPKYRVPEKPRQHSKSRQHARRTSRPAIKAITPSTPSAPSRQHASRVKIEPPAKKMQTSKAPPRKPANAAAMHAEPTAQQTPGQAAKGDIKPIAHVFFVQVGAYRERSSAQQQAAMLLQNGWNSMVRKNTNGLYTVRIGPLSSRSAAGKLRKRLIDKKKLKGFIVDG